MDTETVVAHGGFEQWEIIGMLLAIGLLLFCLGYVLGHVAGGAKAFTKGIEAGAKLYRNNS